MSDYKNKVKKYYLDNKDKFKEYKKIQLEKNPNLHKEVYLKYKDQINERSKQFYKNCKNDPNCYIICECGEKIFIYFLKAHVNTNKHKAKLFDKLININ